MCCGGVYVLLGCLLLSLPGVQCGGSVNYTTTQVCFLKGAPGVLPCRYKYSWGDTYMGGEWYKENSGVVIKHSNSRYPNCSLEIHKITDRHAGVYHFRFYTALHWSWITGTPGITLSVTDLTVKETHLVKSNQAKVTCSASCNLGSSREYIWFKNGKRLPGKTSASMWVSEKANYSCALPGYEAQRSPAVCAPQFKCTQTEYPESKDDGTTVRPKDATETPSPEDVSSFTTAEDGTGTEEGPHVSVPSATESYSGVILPVIIAVSLVLLILLVLGVVYLIRKRNGTMAAGSTTDTQSNSGFVYTTVATRAVTSDPTQQDDQDDVTYTTVQKMKRSKPQTTLQDDSITYASVQFHIGGAATRAENDSVIYSEVN